ncbi:glycoside hydrolase family 3 C-terminal domain-containing protein [Streptomyces sp. NPDC047017]|uniref:glycoside hydrolase family 3 C-terminal domain-containing protein n=1 Tax=Streptomyces sp. NPDC047017 TaxID=3155024 RepID=UPI0033E2F523
MTADHTVEPELSVAQKAALTSGEGDFVTASAPGVAAVRMSDGPHGLRLPREAGDGGQADLRSAAPATCFPPAVALGSSWDPALAERVAGALAAESRAFGVHVVLGPGINIKRSPRCGRNFEYFSEDPLISAEMGGAMVRGLQRAGVGAALKHYAANNQETDRMRVSADVDERALREIYLRAFERIVRRERPWSVMASYNSLNGVPLCENELLLTTILRGEWGFDGVVMSDWGAVRDRVAALRAGLDLQMPGTGGRGDRQVAAAVEDGTLRAGVLDEAVRRLSLFACRATACDASTTTPAEDLFDRHHELAREAAERSVVLLKNDHDLLPLSSTAGSVAVIGELARTPRYQGAGSSQVTPTRLDVPLDELRRRAEGATVCFAPGYRLPGGPGPDAEGDEPVREAEELAAGCDTVLLFLGLPAEDESEGFDRDHIDLPAAQLALLDRVVRANPRVVVVLSNGGAVGTAAWHERVPALLEAWLPGQAGGSALARVLFGEVSPSGRLTETLPLRLEEVPSHLSFPGEEGHVRYGEGVFVGYRGFDARRSPVAFCFGHGLTYTTFEYGHLDAAWNDDRSALDVTVTVTNTGRRAGREVVQVYTHGPDDSRVARPERELRGFAGVELAPGERRRVSITLDRSDLAYYSGREGGWHVEGGRYRIDVGASSRDIRRSVHVTVAGDATTVPLTGRSTLAEWLSHPVGGPLLSEALGGGGDSGPGVFGDPRVRRFLADVPLDVIAGFPLLPLGTEDVAALAAEAAGQDANGTAAQKEG